ncbi:phytanoyl-CoA dioxygenase family protein [Yoonia sp. 2307UL14-13]|uniref:phytanoyl-CoA dioxygenase family protein n=1 Tax=Yoonia sp. 2307UL14-13 TaxID=3126506 RepID=UPI0030AC01C5
MMWERSALGHAALQALDAVFATRGKPGARLTLNATLQRALTPVDRLIRRRVPDMRPVRAVAFDKSPETNWALPWHQDRVIAVKQKVDVAGFTNWTRKGDVWHCEPPAGLLNEMLFVRIHLDDADAAAGAMELAEGSHAAGLVATDRAATLAASYPSHICTALRGDILILPMLTLHRSVAATKPAVRRVLRVDYAAFALPAPLAWID